MGLPPCDGFLFHINASKSSMRSIHSCSFSFLALQSSIVAFDVRLRISVFFFLCADLVVETNFSLPHHVFTTFWVMSYVGSGDFFFYQTSQSSIIYFHRPYCRQTHSHEHGRDRNTSVRNDNHNGGDNSHSHRCSVPDAVYVLSQAIRQLLMP